MILRGSQWSIPALVAGWVLLVAGGLFSLWRYSAIPGDDESPPSNWPAESRVTRDARPTLLFFAHPLCPCTRASLAELARLTAVCGDRVDTHVLFIAPPDADATWRDSDLQREARRIPGVTVDEDADRREARLFRSHTSGRVLLYDANGRLLFAGGLTASRGHEGENAGRQSIEAILFGGEVPAHATPVFGCSLFETDTPRPDVPSPNAGS